MTKKKSSSIAAKNDMMVATTANILVTCKRDAQGGSTAYNPIRL